MQGCPNGVRDDASEVQIAAAKDIRTTGNSQSHGAGLAFAEIGSKIATRNHICACLRDIVGMDSTGRIILAIGESLFRIGAVSLVTGGYDHSSHIATLADRLK